MLVICHRGLDHIAYLRGVGSPWLAGQDDATRAEVDEAEREFGALKAGAILRGATTLPRDEPADPFA